MKKIKKDLGMFLILLGFFILMLQTSEFKSLADQMTLLLQNYWAFGFVVLGMYLQKEQKHHR